MGNIDFIGFHQNYQEIANAELSQVTIPENSTLIYDSKECNDLNLVVFTIPIIVVVLTIIIIKQKRYGFINKDIRKEIQEENISKYNLDTKKKKILFGLRNFFIIYIGFLILMYSSIIIHEYLHAIPAALMGYNCKIAIGIPMGGVTWIIEETLKTHTILFLLTPLLILGIIPAMYSCIVKVTKKNYLKQWIIGLISCMMIFTCGFDIINTYNIISFPNDSYVGEANGIFYWYKK